MRISAKTDSAVRACVELAARHGDGTGFVKATVVAEAQTMSLSFVLVILNELKQAGLVESRRGADGGYRLAVPPDRMVVADVVRAIDGPLANVAGKYVEDLEYGGAASATRDLWVALRVAMRGVLDEVSLADLVAGRFSAPVQAFLASDDAWRTRPNKRSVGTRLSDETGAPST